MAYISQVEPEQATGRLKPVYDAAVKRSGGVANIIRVMGLDPRSCQGSMGFYASLMKVDNALSADRREMLATVVSGINGCYYWTLSHAEGFRRESGKDDVAASLVYDYRTADLDEPDRALCDFAVRVTLRPAEMERADIDRLHAAGFDDEAITIATQVISYFNYINRVADALGVDPEPGMTPPREQWEQGRARDYSEVLG